MNIAVSITPQPTGCRRLTRPMLAAKDAADRFEGVAKGTATTFRYLAAFQEAEPYLGLPSHAYKLVSWLVGQTMAHDWEAGSRPIAWPSARLQQEFLGLSAARVKALNRALFEAGIFVIRDNEQGKRYGRRGPDKRIIEAYGFDLSPLAQRYDEFIRFAAEARAERARMKDLRRRVTIARRAIAAVGDLLATLGAMPAGWRQLAGECADLVSVGRQTMGSGDLLKVAQALEALQAQAEQWVRDVSSPVSIDPKGLVSDPHTTSTNQSFNLKDTVIAAEESRAGGQTSRPKANQPEKPEQPARVSVAGVRKPAQLLELFPRLAQYIYGETTGWREIVDAAGGQLRHELGVSPALWADACRVMGREGAALALAIVSTKSADHFARSAGGYFGGMVRKAEKGELHLERTLWALREVKWGKLDRTRSH